MRAAAPLLTLCLALPTGACRGPDAPAAPAPADVARERMASTVWIGSPSERGVSGYASAVVLGPRHLLTNAHVWSEAEPGEQAALPARRALALLEQGRLVEVPFRLVAAGAGADDTAEDWALLEADAARWEPERAAAVHPSAADPDWAPPEGSALVVAGFSSIFFEPPLAAGGDAPQTLRWEDFAPFVARGPYAVTGTAERAEGNPAVRYPAGWPPPKGHSGGGVYLEQGGELQLVGLFSSWAPTRIEVTQRVAPLGLSFLAFERTSEQDGWLLMYVPLAPALEARDAAAR